MFVKLMRQDCEACEPIVLNSGKHVLGRGLPLKCKDKRISRSHCSLELTEEGVMIFTATHVNPCFWFDVSRQAPAIILHQGEERILKEGDVISLLPDSYKYSVSCEKGVSVNNNSEIQSNMVVPTHIGVLENTGNDNLDSTSIIGSDLPKNDTENLDNKPLNDSNAITNEISNVQDENNSHAELKPDEGNTQNIVTTEAIQSGCVAEADENKTADLAPENTSCDDDKIADGLSDAEVTFDGDDSLDEIEKDVPSPSLLDGVTADTLDKVSSNKREGENNSEASSSAKRHRPNSPEDIKPDVAQLQASVNTGPSVSPVNNVPVDVKVKKEEQDDNSDENNKDDAGPGGSADSSTANNAAPRTKCSFGATCYRKNPIHRVEYCHPGDPDWVIPAPCQWGAQCYRLNPQHRAAFSHPGPPAPRPAPPPGGTDNKKKPVRKAARKRKQSSYSGSESEDEYDMEDPFMADDSSDEYNPSSDAWSSGGSEEESQDVDPESQGTKRLNRRLLREAKKFVGKK